MTNIRGLTYQALIEIIANIEIQEYRRRQNVQVGYIQNTQELPQQMMLNVFSVW